EEADAQEVEDRWRVRACDLLFEDRLLHLGGTAAPPFRGPAHAEVAGFVELPLEPPAELDQAVLGGGRVAELLAPGPRAVAREPGLELVPELHVLGGEAEVHGRGS